MSALGTAILTGAVALSGSFERDDLGRITAIKDADGNTTSYTYDGGGRLVAVTDPTGQIEKRNYDEFDRLISLIDPLGGTTQFAYNPANRAVSVTDARGNATQYTVDGLGRLLSQNNPDSALTVFEALPNGSPTTAKKADGTLIQYTYDALGRLTGEKSGDAERNFVYDGCENGKGQLCGISSPQSETVFTYTQDGLIRSREDWTTLQGIPVQAISSFGYNQDGTLASLTYPDGTAVRYGYLDGLARSLELTTGDGQQKTVLSGSSYTPYGALSHATFGNGVDLNYNYNLNGRLKSSIANGSAGQVQALNYNYSKVGQVSQIIDDLRPSLSQNFEYDAKGQLNKISRDGQTTDLSFDLTGNQLISSTASDVILSDISPSNNQVLGLSAGSDVRMYNYDANGNRISEVVGGVSKTYEYDGFGRLVEVNANGAVSEYVFNALGQRVGKAVGADTVRFAYLGQNELLAEHGLQGWTDYLWFDGRIVGFTRAGSLYFLNSDHLGRPETATDANQSIAWQNSNFAFGSRVSVDNVGGLNIGLPGQYYDQESLLWHNGYRTYDSRIGRYLESDPIGLGGGTNTYIYAGNDPIANVDLLGLVEPQPPIYKPNLPLPITKMPSREISATEKAISGWVVKKASKGLFTVDKFGRIIPVIRGALFGRIMFYIELAAPVEMDMDGFESGRLPNTLVPYVAPAQPEEEHYGEVGPVEPIREPAVGGGGGGGGGGFVGGGSVGGVVSVGTVKPVETKEK